MTKQTISISVITEMDFVIEQLKKELTAFNAPLEVCFDVQLALTEAVSNAFLHGCRELTNPEVVIEWDIIENKLQLRIKDNGPGFRPNQISSFCQDDLLKETGRGIFLIKQVLDKVWFNQKGNEIYGLKRW